MEDILSLYAEPYLPDYPVVCIDESPYQLVANVRDPEPVAPHCPQRVDSVYKRAGTCNLFMLFQPLAGWRHVVVTDQRTKQDFAHLLKELVDSHFPQATLISIVVDNLNTHTPAALYEAFPPTEARRLLDKLEFRYTPKHGSWLNMVEIEFSVLKRQCLNRRIGDRATLEAAIACWEAQRNAAKATVKWRFTAADARTKLSRLYTSIL